MSVESAIVLSAPNCQAARDYLSGSAASSQTIAPLPRVCAQLAELTAQQATDAAQLARLIQSDPALAGEVMRVANSPALRPRTAIVSLQQAVSWLGVAEVRNIAMAVMLRGEVFVAPGHESESEELWREAWLAALWSKEIARERRMGLDAETFGNLIAEFETAFGRLLMDNWLLPKDVQDGASDWRNYRESNHSDLAGTVHAAHLLATHTLHAQLLGEDMVIESPVFEQLGVFPDDRRRLLAKREQVLALAGM